MPFPIYIGCAGWAIRREHMSAFPADGTHLNRYAALFNCVEINSSFKSVHKRNTYERWSASVPQGFGYSVKMPKRITHDLALVNCATELEAFLSCASGLGAALRALLIQLPPSLDLDFNIAETFFADLRRYYAGGAVLEPRHQSWFTSDAEALLKDFGITGVLADPKPVPDARWLNQGASPAYIRLHGTPRIYYSKYERERVESVALEVVRLSRDMETWCIFDNTAEGHATTNAQELQMLCRALLNQQEQNESFVGAH
jgi:uncharacterized protein YecE (DUF72 family)